jgi:DNA-directed RNA polymerase specialized sigma24 family protein
MEWVFCHVRKSFVSDAEAASAIWDSLCDRLGYKPLWSDAGIAKRLMVAVWTKARRSALKEIKARSGRSASTRSFNSPTRSPTISSPMTGDCQPKRPAFREPIQFPTTDCFDASLDELKTRLVRDAGLSAPDAALLVNHIVFGKTLTEMAAEEGVSPAAFRQRFHRAKDRLRKAAEKISPGAVTFSIPDDLGIQRGNEAPAKSNVNGRVA